MILHSDKVLNIAEQELFDAVINLDAKYIPEIERVTFEDIPTRMTPPVFRKH